MSDEWNSYRAFCEQPNVFSRWMLEQTAELMRAAARPELAERLLEVLNGTPHAKPVDHRGGPPTDMFSLEWPAEQVGAVLEEVRSAVRRDLRTLATRHRGLGGFTESWREFEQWRLGEGSPR